MAIARVGVALGITLALACLRTASAEERATEPARPEPVVRQAHQERTAHPEPVEGQAHPERSWDSYVVQPGDTLTDIAARFGVEVGAIAAANRIEDRDTIIAGSRLSIPGLLPPLSLGESWGEGRPVPAPPVAPARPLPSSGVGGPASIVSHPSNADRSAGGGQPPVRTSSVAPVAPDVSLPPTGQRQSNIGAVVSLAMRLQGAPYVEAGATPAGFDCSGFVYFVFSESGSVIPRLILEQYQAGAHPSRSDLRAGDLVFFENTYIEGLSHVGIYLGDGRFIHAVDEDKGVVLSNLTDDYWATRWFGATRIP